MLQRAILTLRPKPKPKPKPIIIIASSPKPAKLSQIAIDPIAKARRERMKRNTRTIALLTSTWPVVFDRRQPKPLAIGIHHDISVVLSKLPKRHINTALHWWVSRKAYLRAIIASDSRYGLDGEILDDIDKDAKTAAARLILEKR
jgi:sRNA-binding protein